MELLTDSFSDEDAEEEPDVLPEDPPEEVLEEPEAPEEPEELAGIPGTVISSVLLVTVLSLQLTTA